MAQPTTAKFGAMVIAIGDGASPEVFTAPCGFSSKALRLSKNLQDVTLPDCDDPDAPAWIGRDVQSLTAQVTGEGVMAEESVLTWTAFFDSTSSLNVRITITTASGYIRYTGAMHLESLEFTAETGGRVQCNVSMQSDGAMTLEETLP
jgi:predicted secreted protein